MNELNLFSGAGCGLLGSHLLGLNPIGYVEIDEYCQRVISQRINDGILREAPIFTDVRKFLESGAASEYRGFADLVTAGFPCQGWSTAASGKNKEHRDLWPETLAVICEVQPKQVFIENVSRKPIIRAGRDLYQMGYTCIATRLSAKDMGADHNRARVWLRAYANNESKLRSSVNAEMAISKELYPDIWKTDPGERGISNGATRRVDRYRATGNGQVPSVVRAAWDLLV